MGVSSGHAPDILGGCAERLAVDYLRGTGWTLVERNYRFGRREVDLILQKRGGATRLRGGEDPGGGIGVIIPERP
jgi:hypothetical protein